jgi:hypothetical protein
MMKRQIVMNWENLIKERVRIFTLEFYGKWSREVLGLFPNHNLLLELSKVKKTIFHFPQVTLYLFW